MPERIISNQRSAVCTDLKLMAYSRALDLQTATVRSKIDNRSVPDHLYFVEHPSVFTLGRRGGRENLTVSESFLEDQKIEVVQTDRGGNITFHGPGQAVLYPVVDLEKNKIAVKDFVYGLEDIMKRTAFSFGIHADRDARNHGLWVKNSKLGSVGISVKKGIAFHGLAMNIFPDLTPFSWINPCGLANVGMTSIEQELPHGRVLPKMTAIREQFVNHFKDIFGYFISTADVDMQPYQKNVHG